jgi:hypothetical protein
MGAIALMLETKVFVVGVDRAGLTRMTLSLLGLISPLVFPHPVLMASYRPIFSSYF